MHASIFVVTAGQIWGIDKEGNSMTRIEFDAKLDTYCEDWEHLYQCIGYSEGMECCLEKKEVRDLLWDIICEQRSDGQITPD